MLPESVFTINRNLFQRIVLSTCLVDSPDFGGRPCQSRGPQCEKSAKYFVYDAPLVCRCDRSAPAPRSVSAPSRSCWPRPTRWDSADHIGGYLLSPQQSEVLIDCAETKTATRRPPSRMNYAAFFLLPIPISPSRPVPNSHTAGGRGTEEFTTHTPIEGSALSRL